ncbi:TRAP transporter small permease [Allopusillimonas ginsengisoli]|uniref:TRAP transporter small permease n=1 Tax=Allopusillimonas ginsengisoli TaxID=453575 RepID=UPI0039C33C7D
MRRLLDRFYLGCMILSCMSIVFIVAVVFIQVLLNMADAVASAVGLPGLGIMIPSYSMFAGYGLAAATFLALGPALRQGAHIRVTLIYGQLSQPVRRLAFVLIASAGTIVGALITWSLLSMTYESWAFGDKSSGLVSISLWIPQSVLCFGAFSFLIACADLLIESVTIGQSASFDETLFDEAST